MAPTEHSRHPRRAALRRLQILGRVGGLALFFAAVYFSARLGVEMARNRLPDRGVAKALPAGGSFVVGESGELLYLAASPESLRRFFSAHPTPDDRAAANLSGLGVRRLRGSMELAILRVEADVVQVRVASGAIAGAVYWMHHSQIPSVPTVDPIISPVPKPEEP